MARNTGHPRFRAFKSSKRSLPGKENGLDLRITAERDPREEAAEAMA